MILETITVREHDADASLAEHLGPTLDALARQTYPRERTDVLVVVDDAVRDAEAQAIAARWPFVRVVRTSPSNYALAKLAGAAASRGEIVAWLDGDCVPTTDWLERLVRAIEQGPDVVAGRTRYAGASMTARTFSVPDFGNVTGTDDGGASGFNLNNVAFRRAVLDGIRPDPRFPRNGSCYLIFHTLRARGVGVGYEPDAVVRHALDVGGLGFASKHFARGFDGATVYRIDDGHVLRGTTLVRRFGPLALPALTARRIALDWARLVRERHQIGISAPTLPYYAGVMVVTRLIELAGGVAAFLAPRPASHA